MANEGPIACSGPAPSRLSAPAASFSGGGTVIASRPTMVDQATTMVGTASSSGGSEGVLQAALAF